MTDYSKLSDAELQALYQESVAGGSGQRGGVSAAPGKKVAYSAPLWDSAEAAASERTGVPADVLRTIRTVGERSNGDQVSPKGARGVYQFIPSSRDAFLKKYGADAYSDDPNEQALAAAYHLKESFQRTKDWGKAMAGYNGGISGENGTNTTEENRAYAARTGAALAEGRARPKKGAVAETLDKITDVLIPSAHAGTTDPSKVTDEDLKAAYASALAAEGAPPAATSTAVADAPPERSTVEKVGHGLGVGARGLIVGAAELPGLVTDAVTGPVNAALDLYHDKRAPTVAELVTGKQKGFRFQRLGAATDNLLTQAGMPQAEGGFERVAQDASRGAAGAVSGVGAGKFVAALGAGTLARAVGKLFSSGPGLQAVAGATSGTAAGATREAGGGEGAQFAAALAGGLAPGGGQTLVQMGARRALVGNEAARQAAAENLAMFKDAGVDPTLAQVTRGRVAQAAESMLAKTPGSAGVMAKVGERQGEQMAQSVRDLADSLAPGADAMQAGEAIQKGINGFKSGMQRVQLRLYSELDKHIPSAAPIQASRTQAALKELNADIEGAPALSEWFKNARIKGIDAALSSDIEQSANAGALPYQAIKKLRTLVGRELADNTLLSDVPRSKWSALYGALTEDLGDAAKAAGPEAAERWQWANTFTRTQLQRLDELSGIMGRDAPEKIFAAATSGAANGNTVIDRVVSAIPKQNRREVAAALLQRLGRATNSKQNAAGDAFSSETFLTNLNAMSPAARQSIFGRLGDPGIEDRVEQLAKIAQTRREDGKVFANPSGTASAAASIMAGGGVGGGLVTFVLTGNPGPLGGAIAAPLAANAAGKWVTNPERIRRLTQPLIPKEGALPSVVTTAGRAAIPGQPMAGEGETGGPDLGSMSDDELKAAYLAAGGKLPEAEPPVTGPDASAAPAPAAPAPAEAAPGQRIEVSGVGSLPDGSAPPTAAAAPAPIVPAEVGSRPPVTPVEVKPTAAAGEAASPAAAPPAGRVMVSQAVYDAIQQAHAAQGLPPALIEPEGEVSMEQTAAAAPAAATNSAPVALAATQGMPSADAPGEPDASAPAAPKAAAQPEVLRNRLGQPFTVRAAALRAAAQAGEGFTVEREGDGFVAVNRQKVDGDDGAFQAALPANTESDAIKNVAATELASEAKASPEKMEAKPRNTPLQRSIERRMAARGVQDGDVLNAQDQPFTVKVAAMRAASKAGEGYEVAAVDGGFVARKAKDGAAASVQRVAGDGAQPGRADASGGVGTDVGRAGAPARAGAAGERAPAAADAPGDRGADGAAAVAGGTVEAIPEKIAGRAAAGEEPTGRSGVEKIPAPEMLASAGDEIDRAAHKAATSPSNDRPEPSEAQREAGNFKKGHIRIAGLDISVENPKGSVRRGTAEDGTEWERPMKAHYGYIKRTEGSDGEQVDVYVGPRRDAPKVYVVDQVKADGSFDEHKAMIGYTSQAAARRAYAEHYPEGFKVGRMTPMNRGEFKEWLRSADLSGPVTT